MFIWKPFNGLKVHSVSIAVLRDRSGTLKNDLHQPSIVTI